MNALRRVLSAPGLVLTLGLLQLLVAWQLANPVRTAARAAIGEYAWIDDGHLMGALIELFATNRAVAALMAENAIVASILGLVFWGLAYGAVIQRLSGPSSPSELAAASVRFLPGVAIQTLYLGIVRAVPMVGIGALAAKLPVVGLILGVLVTAVLVVAADVARVSVVLSGGRRFHPSTARRALRETFTSPRMLVSAGLLAIAQLLVPMVAVYLVLANAGGGGSIWLARLLALGGLGLGLWRIAIVVDVNTAKR